MASQVTMARYHRTYFPSPGFVADGITLRRKSALDLPPLGTVAHVRVEGSWLDLVTLRDRVQLVEMTGLKLEIPAAGTTASQREFPSGSSADFGGPATAILEMRVRDSQLDILHGDGSSTTFPIENLVMRGVVQGKPVHYVVDMENAIPGGHIHAKGTFGPVNTQNLGATPLGDDFAYTGVRLSDVGNVRGTLTAHGKFSGNLGSIQAQASSDTPDFAVGDGRPTAVAGDVRCTINGLNGDVVLNEIALTIGHTPVRVSGSVTGSPKLTDMQVTVPRGRIEDLAEMFMKDRPLVTGAVSLQTHVRVTQGDGDFFSRLQADGRFDLPAEKLTNAQEEKNLSGLSERASEGKQPKEPATGESDVLSSLTGPVSVRDGVVRSDALLFAVPGVSAKLHGTYSFRTTAVSLKGDARMDNDISHVTTGWKSALLKPVAPLFKRKHAGAVVPIEVGGSKGNYHVGPELLP